MKKGQIMFGVITGLAAIIASAFTAWGTASKASSEIDKKVELVSLREELHYTELGKTLDRMEKKIDLIAPPTVVKKL